MTTSDHPAAGPSTQRRWVRRAAALPFAACVVIAVVAVAVTYWPSLHAGLVWDDRLNFTQRGWLYYGDAWKHYVFRGFNDWSVYFRPLVVALYVAQARLFGGAPVALHTVSLGMQLINVALVMLLARRLTPPDWHWRNVVVLLAGLAFGLHPLLVETVVWIGCQFDQMQLMFCLLGLLTATSNWAVWARAVTIAACFLASALCKESALAFPALVVLFDWLRRVDSTQPIAVRTKQCLRNWPVYVLLIIAGIGYLALRHATLGSATAGITLGALRPDWPRVDRVAFTYLRYWMVIGGIPVDYSPLHTFAGHAFGTGAVETLQHLVPALAIALVGLLSLSHRKVATGVAVLAVGLYLAPVLGILPLHFDDSLYHERYAMGAIAMVCVLLPRIVFEWRGMANKLPQLKPAVLVLPVVWLAWAVLNVHTTIPLWSQDVALWQWAVQANPNSVLANTNLIQARRAAGQYDLLRQRLAWVAQQRLDCPGCYVNGLAFAVDRGDAQLAERMRLRLLQGDAVRTDARVRFSYLVSVGRWYLRAGQTSAAIATLSSAMQLERMNSFAHFVLGQALFRDGQTDAANRELTLAVALTPPAGRAEAQHIARQILGGINVYAQPMAAPPPTTPISHHAG